MIDVGEWNAAEIRNNHEQGCFDCEVNWLQLKDLVVGAGVDPVLKKVTIVCDGSLCTFYLCGCLSWLRTSGFATTDGQTHSSILM